MLKELRERWEHGAIEILEFPYSENIMFVIVQFGNAKQVRLLRYFELGGHSNVLAWDVSTNCIGTFHDCVLKLSQMMKELNTVW